jgi:hypothetical protein
MGLGQVPHLVRRDIARDDQDGVVRPVMRVIELDQHVTVELLHLVTPPDDRDAVGMIVVERRAQLFVEDAPGGRVDPFRAFFEDDRAFGHDLFVGETKIAHAVCLELHHQAETVGGDTLEIAGVVPGGEGVVGAAVVLDDAGKCAAFDVIGALEHQVFEEMRHARLTGRFVGRTGAVPDHVHDRGASVILDHDDLHAIVEEEFRNVFRGLRRRRQGQHKRCDQRVGGKPRGSGHCSGAPLHRYVTVVR